MQQGWTQQSNETGFVVGLLVLHKGLVDGLVLHLWDGPIGVHDIKATKQSNGSVLFDAGVLLGQGLHVFFHDGAQSCRVADNIILDEVLDLFVRTRHGNGVSLIGGSPTNGIFFKEIHNGFTAGRHGHGNGRRGDTLGTRDDIGQNSFKVLETKQFSGPSKSHHDFIEMQDNVVLVANGPYALHETFGGNQDTPRTDDGFKGNHGNGIRSFSQDLFFEHG
mmetsp:Transcript_12171/g.23269  ORF Transcript_12171/g.23269 Transcript_12171/m.23269 type:complete len:220 (-) Transcript_12171:822-1481(-)